MKRTITSFILIMLIALSANAQTIKRNETVYANLDSTGKPNTIEVVTWLKNDGQGAAADRSTVANVKNVKGLIKPEVSGNNISFDTTDSDVFYRGTTNKQLPIAVDIEYHLDGSPISFDGLEGKSGKLEITINVKNTTEESRNISYIPVGSKTRKSVAREISVPFVSMINFSLPISKFSNIEAPEGVSALIGDSFKMQWIVVPMPEATIKLKADAKDIAMPSIMITASPKMIPLPDEINQIKPKLDEIYDGVDTVGGYLEQLHDGSVQILDGVTQVEDGTAKLLLASDAQAQMTSGAIKINEEIIAKTDKLSWISSFRKINSYLTIENELLTLVTEGGPFPESVLEFLEEQGKEKPEVDEFPGIAVTSDGISKLNDGSQKLQEGAEKLAENLIKVKAEGTDKIKSGIKDGADDLVIKLAGLDIAKKLAADYDRYTGIDSEIPSSVTFIMKTPGVMSH